MLTVSIETEPSFLAGLAPIAGLAATDFWQRFFNAFLDIYDGDDHPQPYLAEALPPLADHVDDEVFLSLSGESTILEAARRLVSAAHAELNVSLWEPELEGLRTNIAEAAVRGVRIFGMLYSATAAEPAGTWLRHSYENGRLPAVASDPLLEVLWRSAASALPMAGRRAPLRRHSVDDAVRTGGRSSRQTSG